VIFLVVFFGRHGQPIETIKKGHGPNSQPSWYQDLALSSESYPLLRTGKGQAPPQGINSRNLASLQTI
jgi:hypothetical protein